MLFGSASARMVVAAALALAAAICRPEAGTCGWLQLAGALSAMDPAPARLAAKKISEIDTDGFLAEGIAATRAGDWERGVMLLSPFIGRFPMAEDVARVHLARCLINLGRPDEALAQAGAASRVARGPWYDEAGVLAARALADKGAWREADARLSAMKTKDDRLSSEAGLVRALVLSGRGDADAAMSILRSYAAGNPTFREAYNAREMQQLFDRAANGRPVVLDSDGLSTRAQTLLQDQEYEMALEACEELAARDPGRAESTEFLQTWAKVYYRLEDASGCNDKYSIIMNRYQGSDTASGQYRAGLAAWRRGGLEDDDLALSHYRKAFEVQPKAKEARVSLMSGGRLALSRGRYKDAEQFFLDAVKAFPRSGEADEALMMAGLCQLMDGRPEQAVQTLEGLIGKRGSVTPGALYWAAAARSRLGHGGSADVHLRELRRRYPRSYYAALTEIDPDKETWGFDPDIARRLLHARGDRWKRAEAATRALVDEVGKINGARKRIAISAKMVRPFRRVLLFIESGAASIGRPDLRELMSIEPDTFRARAAVLSLYELSGLSRWSSKQVSDLIGEAGDRGDAIAAELGLGPKQLLYPPTWIELLAPICEAENLDPALALSLIRQESAYDADAFSTANARGLGQLIPRTARSVAADLGLADIGPGRIYDPGLNLRISMRHLTDLLAAMNGNVAPALAAYNASEPVARRWAERGLNDMPFDVAVEAIMFQETRDYVKTILSNVAVYRRLYTTGDWRLN